MKKLTCIPLPMAGFILALATFSNLIKSYNMTLFQVLATISVILCIFITLRFATNVTVLKTELKNPIMSSIIATYPMALMVISSYFLPNNKMISFILWMLGILLHLAIIIYFSTTFTMKYKKEQFFPSWYIVYVGIGVSGITGMAHSAIISKISFYFSFISLLALIYLTVKDYMSKHSRPELSLPLKVIYAAPISICLANYMNTSANKNLVFVTILLIVAQLLYAYGVYTFCIHRKAKLVFYPSYAAYTFPLVISPLALKLSINFLSNTMNTTVLTYLLYVEIAIAASMLAYVGYHYTKHILKQLKTSGK